MRGQGLSGVRGESAGLVLSKAALSLPPISSPHLLYLSFLISFLTPFRLFHLPLTVLPSQLIAKRHGPLPDICLIRSLRGSGERARASPSRWVQVYSRIRAEKVESMKRLNQ